MADRTLQNFGEMDGTYAGADFFDSRSSLLEVTLADVPFVKSADQSVWLSGELTLTFTINNTDGAGSLDLIVIRDLLDNTKFKYIANSVTAQITNAASVVTDLVINTDYSVTYVSETVEDPTKDLLQFSFLEGGAAASIPVGSIVTISFRGDKVPA